MNYDAATAMVLDPGALAALADAVGAENTVMIMDTILGSVPEMRGQLRAAARSGNLRGVTQVAHKLRSECAYLGATDLCAQLQQLESGAEDGTLTRPVAEVDLVTDLLEKFLSVVRGMRNARSLTVRS
jgi:HPt (histidine-containing phosphotransfer) domain-containing protein